MTQGPIEFASDSARDDKGPTEYGGRAGLIAAAADGHVDLTAAEMRGVIVRAEPVRVFDELGLFEFDEAAAAVDPVSGRVVDPVWNEEGRVGKPAKVPPRTGNPTQAEL